MGSIEVHNLLKAFVEDVASRPEVHEIMFDDNYGLVYDPGKGIDNLSKAVDIFKEKRSDELVFQRYYGVSVSRANEFSDEEIVKWIRDQLTSHVSQFKQIAANAGKE